jgi:hypothetical protein
MAFLVEGIKAVAEEVRTGEGFQYQLWLASNRQATNAAMSKLLGSPCHLQSLDVLRTYYRLNCVDLPAPFDKSVGRVEEQASTRYAFLALSLVGTLTNSASFSQRTPVFLMYYLWMMFVPRAASPALYTFRQRCFIPQGHRWWCHGVTEGCLCKWPVALQKKLNPAWRQTFPDVGGTLFVVIVMLPTHTFVGSRRVTSAMLLDALHVVTKVGDDKGYCWRLWQVESHQPTASAVAAAFNSPWSAKILSVLKQHYGLNWECIPPRLRIRMAEAEQGHSAMYAR